MAEVKPTKAQFEEYVAIRDSGITNMFDIGYIMDLSTTGLNKPICLYIMKNFANLAKEFDVRI